MHKEGKIFVAGAGGLVGSALVRRLRAKGYRNLLTPGRIDLDLTDQAAVSEFFRKQQPEYVFLAAAKVGGIHANNTYPADFIYQNLAIQTNLIHQAFLAGVKRLLFLGSSCIYPQLAPQPMREEYLLTGPLEPTNEPYAIAKISGIKMCEAYNRQYGTKFLAAMPTNLYGPNDNFHPENSHVLPALIRRFHEAKRQRTRHSPVTRQGSAADEVVVWGSGQPLREFLFVDDMADGCVFLMELEEATLSEHLLSYPGPCFVNLGTGKDVTIRELAERVRQVVGFEGDMIFDASRPDGMPRKLLDISRMQALGWQAATGLHEGIEATYRWFLENIDQVRL
ncbi:MAG TPA: GDP-L-fucose synthase [Desulfuromonadales bacterium]|nr:GDP-L-fucose synthase [Desulfuromonadales bacterium]